MNLVVCQEHQIHIVKSAWQRALAHRAASEISAGSSVSVSSLAMSATGTHRTALTSAATPVSSTTSRSAAWAGSSSGSMCPPG